MSNTPNEYASEFLAGFFGDDLADSDPDILASIND